MVARLTNAALNDGPRVALASDGQAEFPVAMRPVVTADVAHLDPLERGPDALFRVQIGRGAWALLPVETLGGAVRQDLLDGLGARDGRAVPDH